MKYMLMFCDRPHGADDDFDDGLVARYVALQQEAERNGTFVTGAPLQRAGSGARVRVADGETVVTDGPFAEATDLLSGFFIIDAPTRDDAIASPRGAGGRARRRRGAADLGTRVKYLLLLAVDGPVDGLVDLADPDNQAVVARYQTVRHDLEDEGVWCGGEALQPSTSATGLRVRDGRVVLHDGPTVGSTDRLVGYYLVDCDDLDHAIEVSARIPIAEHGTVEIRPVREQHVAMQGPAP